MNIPSQSEAVSACSTQGLYDARNEHDACGVGFVAHIKGQKRHDIVESGLQILANLTHRGAVGADPKAGDGCGILTQIPDRFFRREMAARGLTLPVVGEYGVGMIFLPQESASCAACMHEIERAVHAEGQVVLGWRDVPVNPTVLGETVIPIEPVIKQIFVGRGQDIHVTDALERKLYVIRRVFGRAIAALNLIHGKEFYVPSFSARTIVYKGLLLSDQLGAYYPDLHDADFVSALALVHQRFSTNTFPSWELAHPFRYVAHNGEINTLRGNFNWMRAREQAIASPILGDDLKKIWPLINEGQSDSASFDNALELLLMGGYSLAHALRMLIPEAWEKHTLMDDKLRAFYEYHAAMMEPWDGPAAMAFTDGRQIGATLDRNGLRPARYFITEDDMVVLSSEAGVLPMPQAKIVKKWRLQPGRMFLIDLDQGRIVEDEEIRSSLAQAKPYKEWIDKIRIKIDSLPAPQEKALLSSASVLDRQQAFGYSQEDLKILMPMLTAGEEMTGSMGNDTPLAILSDRCKLFYDYFRQLFAQVTNPPIDPIREELVMSLVSFIGPKPNLLGINDINPPLRLEVAQPILTAADIEKIRHVGKYTKGKFCSHELNICYPVSWGNRGIEARLALLAAEAEDAVLAGNQILIVSDRLMDAAHVAIPALLATSAIHQHLVRKGLRTSIGLVVETGSAREVHHFALLGGYGAEAVHPYLALETVEVLSATVEGDLTPQKAVQNFIKAIGKGLCKVMSKMGISTYMSYTGAQIFEAVGLQRAFIDQYFYGTSTQIEGIGIFEVAEEAIRAHLRAFGDEKILERSLDVGGEHAFRIRGEAHMWTPDSIAKLQHATRAGNYKTYQEYARLINDQSRRLMTLRGLFEFRLAGITPIPLEEVEPASEIVKRFATGAMSLGSISTEAHVTLAIAMNRIGAKSNTGEGGEDARRYLPVKGGGSSLADVLGHERVLVDIPLREGDSLRSKIKQVASGRFGVTAEYLANADQIQIKMAQGAKPGEGGQLPGHKVSDYIGELRYSVPGVGLISPPPHHDIYSIEDLAQLIHDLKSCNPVADISVKLVAEQGVGTVAAGVVKAKADHVVIAGHDGGTGASPLSSIKRTGSAWELGLAETQQTLVLNGLRGRTRVQVDGQIKTGRDVVVGALLGAEEFGFATAPLVVQGCIMMRKCHLNTCPVGVATQDPDLRKKFTGKPEHVINYFFFVAEEVRELMASLGVRRFDELVGRSDLLDMRQSVAHWKAKGLDFSRVFYRQADTSAAVSHVETQDHGLQDALDHQLIKLAQPALENKTPVRQSLSIRNVNRSVGAMLSGRVAQRYGHVGLPDNTLHFEFTGTAGQSFAAFLPRGVTLELVGEGNDYVGKGLSGGRVIVRPQSDFMGKTQDNIIVGNTVMYGAVGGEAYFCGVAGERFLVRNSGAFAVVEGVGDHGCEYMTGGTCVVLGRTGRNFAAGMSGGLAYVYDPAGVFASHCNLGMVDVLPVPAVGETPVALRHLGYDDDALLLHLISQHATLTGSEVAQRILADWTRARTYFVKVFPKEYQRALLERAELGAQVTA